MLATIEIIQTLVAPALTFGEAYMRGDIEVRGPLQDFLRAFHLLKPDEMSPWYARFFSWLRRLPRKISSQRAIANAQHHYDIGSDFYKSWLDPSLTDSCAYYLRETDDLPTAQQQKLELHCRKARFAPGNTLLDIGCGWGSLLVHAAQYFDVRATGVTAEEDQADYIEALARRKGLTDRIRVQRSDWRDIDGTFDRIVSVGMFKQVGVRQYPKTSPTRKCCGLGWWNSSSRSRDACAVTALRAARSS